MTSTIICTCNIYVQQPKELGVYAAWCATHCRRTQTGNMRPVAKTTIDKIPVDSYIRRVEGKGVTRRYVTLKVGDTVEGRVALNDVRVSLPSAFHQDKIMTVTQPPIERYEPMTNVPKAPHCSMDDITMVSPTPSTASVEYKPRSPLSYAESVYKAPLTYDAVSTRSMQTVSGRRQSTSSMQSIISRAGTPATIGFIPMDVDRASLSSSVGSATSLNLSTIIELEDAEHSPSESNLNKILDNGLDDYTSRQSNILRDSNRLLNGSGATYDKLIQKNQAEMQKFNTNKANAKHMRDVKERMIHTIASRFLFEEWDIRMLTQIRDQTIREFVKEKITDYNVLDIMYVVEGVLVEHGTATARLDAIATDDAKMTTMVNSHRVANNIISPHHEHLVHKVCRKIVAKLPWHHANISMVANDLGDSSELSRPLK